MENEDDYGDEDDDELPNDDDGMDHLSSQQNFVTTSKTSDKQKLDSNKHNTNHKPANNRHSQHHYYDEEDDDDDDFEEDDGDGRLLQKRNRRSLKHSKRKVRHPIDMIQYTWFRNGENISETQMSGFRMFANGALRISNTENATGVYRCMAKDVISGAGAILSKKCSVSIAG